MVDSHDYFSSFNGILLVSQLVSEVGPPKMAKVSFMYSLKSHPKNGTAKKYMPKRVGETKRNRSHHFLGVTLNMANPHVVLGA